MSMRMRARPCDWRPSVNSFAVSYARKSDVRGGGGENGSALLFGASLAPRLWLARRREK